MVSGAHAPSRRAVPTVVSRSRRRPRVAGSRRWLTVCSGLLGGTSAASLGGIGGRILSTEGADVCRLARGSRGAAAPRVKGADQAGAVPLAEAARRRRAADD